MVITVIVIPQQSKNTDACRLPGKRGELFIDGARCDISVPPGVPTIIINLATDGLSQAVWTEFVVFFKHNELGQLAQTHRSQVAQGRKH